MPIFISYSRRDKDFVRLLYDALTATGEKVWVDWEDIPIAAELWSQIAEGIERADNVIFVISPTSLASPICHLELAYASQLQKRLIPILLIEPDANDAFAKLIARAIQENDHFRAALGDRDLMSIARNNWQHIAQHNWVSFIEPAGFDENFKRLVRALTADLDYIREHTRYLVRAREWERRSRKNGYLLQDAELKEARLWLNAAGSKTPEVTVLHREYIGKSVGYARFRRRLLSITLLALILAGLGIGAVAVSGSVMREDVYRSMVGAFNIAVADFYELHPDGTMQVTEDSRYLGEFLQNALSENFPQTEAEEWLVDVRGDFEPIMGSTADERERAAANVARQVYADVVIYGYIDISSGNAAHIVPEFYTSPSLSGADEATGTSALGSPAAIRLPIIDASSGTPTNTWASFREDFDPRLQSMLRFFRGLNYLKATDYDRALIQMEAALGTDTWSDQPEMPANEIVYLWLGTLFAQAAGDTSQDWSTLACPAAIDIEERGLDLLGCAAAAYSEALERNPSFVRADIGQGNLFITDFLMPPINDCFPVMQAIAAYERALDETYPATPLIRAKAHYSLGRAYQFAHTPSPDPESIRCQPFFSDIDLLEQAEFHLNQAISLLEGIADEVLAPDIKQISAQAHYQLGLVAVRQQDFDQAFTEYDAAYRLAIPDDVTRSQAWQDIRWYALWRTARLHASLAPRQTEPSASWDSALTALCPVLEAVNAGLFTDRSVIENTRELVDSAAQTLGERAASICPLAQL